MCTAKEMDGGCGDTFHDAYCGFQNTRNVDAALLSSTNLWVTKSSRGHLDLSEK